MRYCFTSQPSHKLVPAEIGMLKVSSVSYLLIAPFTKLRLYVHMLYVSVVL